MQQNQYYSYNLRELPLGCQYCVRGEKLVLFITGLCPRRCYFCPVSDHKYSKDGIYANERLVRIEDDLIAEVQAMNALGVGITGGDPLTKVERCVAYIKLLKQRFGPKFHIHLYTSLNLVTEKTLQRLHQAGLDEIRFHLDLESKNLWPRLTLARTFSWSTGVEVPLIPTKEEMLRELLDFVHDKVDFCNLNELEMSDCSQSKLGDLGFVPKNELSYGVKDSAELGIRLLAYGEQKYQFPIQVCTAKLKDYVQMGNRIKREAQGVRKSFDVVDADGLLIRGALYDPELVPGFRYRESLDRKREQVLARLTQILPQVQQDLKLTATDFYLDEQKPRILLSAAKVRQQYQKVRHLGLKAAVVKEYPTADQIEMEVDFV